MSISDKIHILREIAAIPNEDREMILDQVCQLIPDTMSASNKIEILRTLLSITREDRESIINQVIRLLADITDKSDPLFFRNIKNMIIYFTFIPREDREIIVSQSLLLISNHNISLGERFNLIGILFYTPDENRAIIVRQVQQLINYTTPSTSDRSENIIEQSLRLIAHTPHSMSTFEK